ncbi:unnamed protein product [Parnassius mnemosyne]|uniref:Uncharacterized protein n=1 Tax=Parnassius mnemosyne TaxID=213953 RepID=A0AAV1M8N9_9NEOP
MDQGIIKVLKHGYRTRFIHRYLKEMEDPDNRQTDRQTENSKNGRNVFNYLFLVPLNHFYYKNIKCTDICYLQFYYMYIDVNNTQKAALSDDDEGEGESIPILSNTEALSAVNDLRRYVSSFGKSEDALQKLNCIESLVINNASKSFRQTKISDYSK